MLLLLAKGMFYLAKYEPRRNYCTLVDMGVRTIWEGNKCLTSSYFDAKYCKIVAKNRNFARVKNYEQF